MRKVRYKYTGSEPDPVFDVSGDAPPWALQSDEFYVRDVSGKEIAIYSGSSLTQWNIWGLDNVGKINADTTRNYYLKDHLGSIRVVLNSTNTVVSAQDYDAWGYPLENRTYNSSAMRYDFTGKERDDETSYDYFGARYYDSRVANWTSIDPLFEKHYSYSPYNYVLRSPLILVDPDGMQTNLHTYQLSDENLSTSSDYRAIGESYDDEAVRKGRKNPFMPQPGILEAEVIDPVDLLTGMAMAKLSFKLAEKFVFKEGAEIVSESVTKGVVKETTEEVVKFSSKKVEELYKGFVEYLGEGAKGKLTHSFDVRFTSVDKMKQIRFDINKFSPHNYPHIDIQKGFIKNGRVKWQNIGKIKLE